MPLSCRVSEGRRRRRVLDATNDPGGTSQVAGTPVQVDVRVLPQPLSPSPLTGLVGRPQSAGWLDGDNAVVTSYEANGTSVYVCPMVDMTCTRVAFSKDDVRLAE